MAVAREYDRMASSLGVVEAVIEAMSVEASDIRSRAMFGEHVIYCHDRVVALVCDNQLFVKITPRTTALIKDESATAPPYQGAKDCFVVDEIHWGDEGYLGSLALAAARDLPLPKVRKKKP